MLTNDRVKLPKTFLAINLSEAFTFQEKERHSSEADTLDQTATPDPSGEVLEMKRTGGHSSGPKQSTSTDAFAPASLSEIATAASNLAGDASQTPLQLGSALPPGRSNADADRSEATETPEVPQV